jgi:hypothetical protein
MYLSPREKHIYSNMQTPINANTNIVLRLCDGIANLVHPRYKGWRVELFLLPFPGLQTKF